MSLIEKLHQCKVKGIKIKEEEQRQKNIKLYDTYINKFIPLLEQKIIENPNNKHYIVKKDDEIDKMCDKICNKIDKSVINALYEYIGTHLIKDGIKVEDHYSFMIIEIPKYNRVYNDWLITQLTRRDESESFDFRFLDCDVIKHIRQDHFLITIEK